MNEIIENIKELSLASNNISREGVQNLAENVLSTNLKSLDLRFNNIGNDRHELLSRLFPNIIIMNSDEVLNV